MEACVFVTMLARPAKSGQEKIFMESVYGDKDKS
jgi:hypothetical protein